ncbi:LrgB family protein [Pseudoroseomonas cervicalis]|uniref:Putative TIGR00659 family protein n=1 Tax=Pseudoroseomonas cervicalis ATCC 49957 TaxID=525371 RepID=D5RSA8_9PROT|nr:LrgB family protein [Pseudoroseomonas cervicalis]EFH09811.1 putative TIGR00659 family protein [Pseudoroseomonas cervicalis ATCC 49957]
MVDLQEIWVYLARDPLAALTATLLAWMAGLRLAALCRWHPAANPVLFAVALLATGLLLTGIDYRLYFQGAQFVHFLLGPATVALAVPLYRQWQHVRSSALAAVVATVSGGMVAASVGVALGLALHAAPEVTASLAPRSVTTPVAMGIAAQIGGLPGLTAAVVLASGVVGATLGPLVLNLARVRDWRARGLAMGTAAHGLGTARAISVNATAGAFSGLAMGLNALATALLLPLLWGLLFG